MNYSQTGIANLALGRIGARGGISDINENTPNAKKVLVAWDAIFQEVLSERDWKFAKTRTQLQLSPQVPLYTWHHAWAMPSDFLRFVRPLKRAHDRHNFIWLSGWAGDGWYHRDDPPFWPHGHAYKVETMPTMCGFVASIALNVMTVTGITTGQLSLNQPVYGANVPQGTFIAAFGTGTGYGGNYTLNNSLTVASEAMTSPNPLVGNSKFALTNYNGCHGPAKITYIQLISDYTQLMPGFVNCLANRLAAELSIAITEDKSKFDGMMQMYRDSLNSAEAQNESSDYQKDETGSDSWVDAGRRGCGYGYGGGGL